ncbi:MAG TPA: hypothetical protein VIL36_02345, partial [Acidimicrobiales bacterium]
HEKQLTREEITASVHYIRWELTPEQIDRFASAVEDAGASTGAGANGSTGSNGAAAAASPAGIVVDHPNLQLEVDLRPDTAAELLADLRHGG